MAQETIQRMHIAVHGAVQGVGFRPFVYRLATELGLTGWVANSALGVFIEVEGEEANCYSFLSRLKSDRPPLASIQRIEVSNLPPAGDTEFKILASDGSGSKTALLLPDMATCSDCYGEIFNPANRRYLYPFTNCTNCGPRFTIIEALPYDRPNTTMKKFHQCAKCRTEYENPLDRRFHAQPNACPDCGPHLELWGPEGKILASHHGALLAAAKAILEGAIIAVKGLGGFHLMVDARRKDSVVRLRQRKLREGKPLALMYPSLEAVERHCAVSEKERLLLLSPKAPIVLLRRKDSGEIASAVAPGNPYLGVMLPYTPLHHILMREVHAPVVATSGNLSEEPICTEEKEALLRLHAIADLFLVHNRPIAQHADDSVVRVMAGQEVTLRCGRGYAPLSIELGEILSLAATGAHIKNTVAISVGTNAFLSQHIGDLGNEASCHAFQHTLNLFKTLYELHPISVACDLHPDYPSTRFAHEMGIPCVPVQHHYAHVLSCMAEHRLTAPVLGVSWDGTGYGPDGTVWGGEFLKITENSFTRVAHLRPFGLPGGEKAVREPRRAAIGLLYEIFKDEFFSMRELEPIKVCSEEELKIFQTMLQRKIQTPRTTSAGRLFDAVAALTGIAQKNQFEGQAAMYLEFSALQARTDRCYPISLQTMDAMDSPVIVDWEPMMREMLKDLSRETGITIAARFHNTLAQAISLVAQRFGEEKVVLTGGCFQNGYLTDRTVQELRKANFRVYCHSRIPPNDGGIALGQIMAAARQRKG